MTLNDIRQLCDNELLAVDELLTQSLDHTIPLVNEVTLHLVQSGGKRLRPQLALLSAMALGYTGKSHIHAAVILEMIHTATLLHDDVIDASQTRRGRETVNSLWNGATSVLTGDFLYSKSFQLLVELGSLEIMRLFANTTNFLAEGELRQLTHRNQSQITIQDYLKVIENKTAKLFETAALIGPTISAKSQYHQAFSQYGLNLGMAFQITDDILDLTATATTLGKEPGDDIKDGKMTLPLIYAMEHVSTQQKALITSAIESGSNEAVDHIKDLSDQCGAIEYSYQVAYQYAEKSQQALEGLPTTPYSEALIQLAQLAVKRQV